MSRGKKWDSDGVDGGPSSIDVLLEWLMTAGNAKLWQRQTKQVTLIKRIHGLFLRRGFTHRSRHSIRCKLWELRKQFSEAEEWLKRRGFYLYDTDDTSKRAVLKICPYYPELESVFRSSQFSGYTSFQSYGTKVVTNGSSTCTKSEDESSDDDIDDECGSPHERSRGSWSRNVDLVKARWDSDGAGGRPSSFSVLLKWIKTPGNAVRWRDAVQDGYGSRVVLADEIYDFLLAHGVTHRTRGGVTRKFHTLKQQLENAENWLKDRGIRHFKDTHEAEQSVLQMCPIYSELKTLSQPVQHRTTATQSQAMGISKTFRRVAHDTEPSRLSSSKRIRVEHHWRSSRRVDTKDSEGVAILEAEPEERREFFELELQVKRDNAICVRAKARKELLGMGVSRDDVDRLLPL